MMQPKTRLAWKENGVYSSCPSISRATSTDGAADRRNDLEHHHADILAAINDSAADDPCQVDRESSTAASQQCGRTQRRIDRYSIDSLWTRFRPDSRQPKPAGGAFSSGRAALRIRRTVAETARTDCSDCGSVIVDVGEWPPGTRPRHSCVHGVGLRSRSRSCAGPQRSRRRRCRSGIER